MKGLDMSRSVSPSGHLIMEVTDWTEDEEKQVFTEFLELLVSIAISTVAMGEGLKAKGVDVPDVVELFANLGAGVGDGK